MSKKPSIMSFKKLKRLFDYTPATKLDAYGFSEERVIALLKMTPHCRFIHLGTLKRLKKDQIKGNWIVFKQFNPRRPDCYDEITVLLTPYLAMLIKKLEHLSDSEYVFPFFQLTDKENIRLQQARSGNETDYNRLLLKMEAQKSKDSHVRIQKYLDRLSTKLRLPKGTTMYGIRIAMVQNYNNPELYHPITPEDLLEIRRVEQLHIQRRSRLSIVTDTPLV